MSRKTSKCAFRLGAFLLTVLLSTFHAMAQQVETFSYDASLPLDLKIEKQEKIAGARVRWVSYNSPMKGRISALLVIPSKLPPNTRVPAVLYLHWGRGDKREFISEALILARANVVGLSIDAPWARPVPFRADREGNINDPVKDFELYRQTVLDLRRSVDLLVQTAGVDPGRIGYVGHSYGATWGGVLAGVERRLKAFVLMAGLPSVVDFEDRGADKSAEIIDAFTKESSPAQIKNYIKTLSPISPENFIIHSSPAGVMMQFARFDPYISRAAALHYFEVAGQPKEIRWYESSHEVNAPDALRDRCRFLARRLKFDVPSECKR